MEILSLQTVKIKLQVEYRVKKSPKWTITLFFPIFNPTDNFFHSNEPGGDCY